MFLVYINAYSCESIQLGPGRALFYLLMSSLGRYWFKSEKLQKLQNRAARVIITYEVSSASLLSELGWNDLAKNRVKQKAILIYKDNNYCAHQYLQQLFTPNVSRYDLRNSLNKLSVPKPRTDYLKCLKCSFSYSGASLWNSLPEQLKSLRSTSSLKSSKVALNNFLEYIDFCTAIM